MVPLLDEGGRLQWCSVDVLVTESDLHPAVHISVPSRSPSPDIPLQGDLHFAHFLHSNALLDVPDPAEDPSPVTVDVPSSEVAHRPLMRLTERLPTNNDRYTRSRTQTAGSHTSVVLRAQPIPIERTYKLPAGWKEYIHPEGQLYYTSTVDINGRGLTVVTDYPLRPRSNHERITLAIEQLRNMALHHPLLSRSSLRGMEACILVREDDLEETGYYIVNHHMNARTIFYLRDTNPTNLGLALPFEEEDTAATALQVQYWRHVIDYPSHRELPEKVVQLLGPLMAHSCLDRRLCDDSTAPGSIETLENLQKLWRQVKGLPPTAGIRPDRNWIAARLFYYFLRPRISKLYGTDLVRLDRSVRVSPQPASLADAIPRPLRIISRLLLWNDPLECMNRLEDCWREGIAQAEIWSTMMTEFQSEWDQKNAYSTLAFVAALAALAIPSQGGSNEQVSSFQAQRPDTAYSAAPPTPQIQQAGTVSATGASALQYPDGIGVIAGSFSQAFAIFTCMFALANVIASYKVKRMFKGRIMSRNDNSLQLRYMSAFEQTPLGPFKLAFFLSLPSVCFQWSLTFLCLGLATLAFQLHRDQPVFFYIEIVVAILLFAAVFGSICIDPNRLDEAPIERSHQELSSVSCNLIPICPIIRRVRFAEPNEVHDGEIPAVVAPATRYDERSSGTSSSIRLRDFSSIREVQQLPSS
ncbi:hypothetical protein M407DRAFT_19173 [Tulasnella calospora MUT 4182]|uniref:WW domain-containing protein n=1 Tax=Tulasnella calospora MUT 4182 TaxID=1051891 RepID=A0A0C3QU66_9AGAM|nr:hypothetical protein M407DRAFT_19173 [Tulasnella calospora MUT 4182]